MNNDEKEFYLTSKEIATILGISDRTVQRYRDAGGYPKLDGGFPLIKLTTHYLDILKKDLEAKEKLIEDIHNGDEAKKLKLDKQRIYLKKLTAEARLKELDVLEREGLLVDEEEITTYFQNLVIRAKSKMLAIPGKIALELSGISDEGEINRLLTEAIDTALYELSLDEVEDEFDDDDY